MPIEIDPASSQAQHFKVLPILAEKHGLTTYDAAYLELAQRKKASLATLDRKLCLAAEQYDLVYQ